MCPRPRPGAGDGDILVAGHKRSPAVTVVTTHGQMVRQRHGDKLQEFLPHSTFTIATAEMSAGSWVDQAFMRAKQEARNVQFYTMFLLILDWFSCGP